ncbi:cupredoxin domain-containing protein [Halopenitus persicus]|uniref:Plastocyanin n=1 Tax=Halopenitus persicus TaxID=1048396 RepID=A0A1H3HAN6_9EURY|nr:plastocyanin/azurin family copper-binding protein [Halopenitus persicus]QHS16069.1 halocyanin [haloarchaeon 3A1-DGR]SDY11689.1 Plastocyanin [Halopenitus persicus]
MQRRRFLERAAGAATVAAALPISGCLGSVAGGQSERDYDVGMTATTFRPQEVTIAVGESVTWRNTSARTHTVTAYEDAIPEDADFFATGGYEDEATAREEWWSDRGGALENGDEFTHTFEIPGRYDYVCVPHEQGGMIGAVIVEG